MQPGFQSGRPAERGPGWISLRWCIVQVCESTVCERLVLLLLVGGIVVFEQGAVGGQLPVHVNSYHAHHKYHDGTQNVGYLVGAVEILKYDEEQTA